MSGKDREELLEASLEILESKKVASKAIKEISKRVLSTTSGDKEQWSCIRKLFPKMGKGWIDNNPLSLNNDKKNKDPLSVLFIRLLNVVSAFESFNESDMLIPYISELQEFGIKLSIDSSKFEHYDVSQMSLEEELESIKSWTNTIDEVNDTLTEEHAPKSEELNFTAAPDYKKVLSLYNRKIHGKDIDDTVQDILTRNELLDTACNLIQDLQVGAE